MRIAFGAAALAILIPPHAFPGAGMLDWIGLGGAIAVLGINYLQNRAAKANSRAASGAAVIDRQY